MTSFTQLIYRLVVEVLSSSSQLPLNTLHMPSPRYPPQALQRWVGMFLLWGTSFSSWCLSMLLYFGIQSSHSLNKYWVTTTYQALWQNTIEAILGKGPHLLSESSWKLRQVLQIASMKWHIVIIGNHLFVSNSLKAGTGAHILLHLSTYCLNHSECITRCLCSIK